MKELKELKSDSVQIGEFYSKHMKVPSEGGPSILINTTKSDIFLKLNLVQIRKKVMKNHNLFLFVIGLCGDDLKKQEEFCQCQSHEVENIFDKFQFLLFFQNRR